MGREELTEMEADQVSGGSFNWWKDPATGERKCYVTGTGLTYLCSIEAKDTYAWLKAEHRGEGWTEEMYVDALLQCGDFTLM